MALKILVVEDEVKVARFLRRGLETEGYVVDTASDGPTGERKARAESFDLVILDVLLPRKNGFDVLKDLRADGTTTPVLLLTARSTTEDIVSGLDFGADDYLTKPFSFEVLLARVRSLLRRSTTRTQLRVGDLLLDTISHKAARGDRTIDLTAREYALLEHFMRHAGKLITRLELARDVWGYDFDPGTNIVDVYVNHLRKKIDTGVPKKLLHTERGRGYVLEERNGPA